VSGGTSSGIMRGESKMELSDSLWTEKWSRVPYEKVVDGSIINQAGFGPIPPRCGCDDEPVSSLWCACLAEGMGAWFREGLRILDFGCGYGRFFNFLSGRLRNFAYFGLEIAGSVPEHGEQCLRFAESVFGKDGRAEFGFSGTDLETRALKEADVVLLGSVFAHVDFERLDRLFSKFIPVIEKGGAVVFSTPLGDKYQCEGPGFVLEMGDQFYQQVTYTRPQLTSYFGGKNLLSTEVEYFQAPIEKNPTHSTGGGRQDIFRVEA
jgi:SAM-dependent methyltransferase